MYVHTCVCVCMCVTVKNIPCVCACMCYVSTYVCIRIVCCLLVFMGTCVYTLFGVCTLSNMYGSTSSERPLLPVPKGGLSKEVLLYIRICIICVCLS